MDPSPHTHIIAPLDIMPPIPVGDKHPGAFGFIRSHDVHTGVDLYAAHGSPVRAMETGRVTKIEWFTGPSINMPWWIDTRAVAIEGATGVFNYGEIQEYPDLKVGDIVEQGQYFGYVVQVLRKYKGRPMSMLHVELYDHGYADDWSIWNIFDPQPELLKDPTPYLLTLGIRSIVDPYHTSQELFRQHYIRQETPSEIEDSEKHKE